MDTNAYDVVIVGAGSGGVSVASMLVDAGRRVALVASGFVGGACPYVACMPSKSLVRSARARTEARELVEHGAAGHAVDVGAEGPAWVQAVRRRDETANNRDDTKHAEGLREQGIDVVRGFGVLVGGGNVEVDGRVLHGEHIVIDTGSVPVRPDIDGLEAVPWWTSDQALTSDELPERLLVLGGGPIGCELAQAYAAFGTAVTIVDTATRLVPSEDDVISQAMMRVLQVGGVRLVLGATPGQVEPDGEGVRMNLNNGTTLHADRLLVVVGRKPATEGLDAEAAGATLADDGSIATDEYCRAAPGLWAIGDVTGLAPYTHTANHQARVVGDAILGRKGHPVTADVLPRAVFTEPPLGAAGLTETQARDRDIDVVVVDVDLADVSRAGAEGQGPLGPPNSSGGVLRLIINRDSRLLLGAAAVGPHADAWIGEATLAIRARVPVDVLADVVRPFPTYPEAFTLATSVRLTNYPERPLIGTAAPLTPGESAVCPCRLPQREYRRRTAPRTERAGRGRCWRPHGGAALGCRFSDRIVELCRDTHAYAAARFGGMSATRNLASSGVARAAGSGPPGRTSVSPGYFAPQRSDSGRVFPGISADTHTAQPSLVRDYLD